MNSVEFASRQAIDTLEQQLDEMRGLLEQEKSDHGRHTWGDISEMNYMIVQIENVIKFWRNEEA